MTEVADEPSEIVQSAPEVSRNRRWLRVLGRFALLLLVALGVVWTQREELADRIIASQLEQLKLSAKYKVESVGARRQVLTDVVIGDPARPDFTATRAEIIIEPRWGIPTLKSVTLTKARIYGAYRGGKLSFGALDPILFKPDAKDEPFRLPDLDLRLIDARGRMDTDYGLVGLKLDGGGNLRGRFGGTLAAVAPRAAVAGCGIAGATLYGKLAVVAEQPKFAGPVRLRALACPAQGLTLAGLAAAVDLTLDKPLDGLTASADLTSGSLAYGDQRAGRTAGKTSLTFRKGDLTADYDLTGRAARVGGVAMGALALNGALRSYDRFARIESEGTLSARELRPGGGLDAALASAGRSADGTFAAPMLAQIRSVLARQAPGSSFSALYTLRQTGRVTNLMVPRGAVRGGGGAPLLSVSRFELVATPGAAPRFAGNVLTGGPGLPVLSGRLERQNSGGMLGKLQMAEYRAGTNRLALPELVLVQNRDGSLGFGGRALLTGPLPGGIARNLALPLDGIWSPRGGLAVWRRCIDLRFDELGFANLTLTNRQLLVCPGPGGAILRADAGGVKLAAGAPSLNVAGRLGTTPIRIASGAVGFAMPGSLSARSLNITLGPAANATTFRISNLSARVGNDIAGRFADTEARIGAVPLDIVAAGGDWRYANGALTLTDGAFRLEDREAEDRFEALVARDATLTLVNNRITAQALLREPKSDRAITTVDIGHNLNSGTGHADLRVDGLTFDQQIQPDTLTYLAQGVVALAKGTVTGTGRIDWNPDRVTSSGRFSTDKFDFAAAFGPVRGASGTVVFTDLLGLVTAPDQQVRLATINPGIEVNDGLLTYQLEPDGVLQVKGAVWPFMDGMMRLLPTRMVLGAAEQRRFEIEIEALNSARFIERLQFGNLNSTGIFDGTLPLVFDENGGRIVGGRLVSRAPGGNVSYIGELTYRDLSAMGNYAFEMLRSLDYQQMVIGMEGDLDGEIATSVKFDGVRQGKGAKRNLITRQFEGLPIQFNVNLRASFFELITTMRSLYDESYIPSPQAVNLIDKDGKPIPPQNRAPLLPPSPVPDRPAPDVQPPASRNKR